MVLTGAFHFDAEVDRLLKHASENARKKDFNAAIEVMKKALNKVWGSDVSYSFETYTKILPYFQKAGLYGDGIEFANKELIPKLVQSYEESGSTGRAFICLYVGKVFEKLALNAKRENKVEDELFFTGRAKDMDDSYLKLMEVGKIEDLKAEYHEMLELFGRDHSKWPASILKKFDTILR
jgi:hypothetical protein